MAEKFMIPFEGFLNILLFLNFVFVFTVGETEGLSKLIIISSVLLFCALLVKAIISRSFYFPRLSLLYLAFWAYTCISLCWTPDLYDASTTSAIFTSSIFSTMVLWFSLYQTNYLKVLKYGVVVVLLVQVFFLLTGDPLPAQENRIGGLSDNPNDAALEISMMAFLASVFFNNWLIRNGLVWGGIAATLLTGTRKIMFTLVGLLVITGMQFFKYMHSKNRLVISIVIVCFFAVILAFSAGSLVEKIAGTSTYLRINNFIEGKYDSSATDRTELIKEAYHLWFRNPVFGNGVASFAALGSYGMYAHNNYVEILTNYGIVGFILFYLFDLIVMAKLFVKAKNGSALHQYLLVILFIVLLYDTSMVSYYSRSSTQSIRILLAFLADRDEMEQEGLLKGRLFI